MLFIPLIGKISWKNPPAVTLVLIAINMAVWAVYQSGETDAVVRTQRTYWESQLAEIEIDRYGEYLRTRGDASTPRPMEGMDEDRLQSLAVRMLRDDEFQRKLVAEEIITPDDAVYSEWRPLRTAYEDELARLPSMRYGLRPAAHHPLTFVTYMFLHGGLSHLIGNLVFLWVFGCIIEMGCGRPQYAGIYLVSGLMAGILFWGVYPQSLIPLVGASGAISGLMGALTVVYGRQKIRFFVYLGFYFANYNIPAFLLLPIWIGNEVYQLAFGGLSNVAYVAHIGGLMAGAALGLVYRQWEARQPHASASVPATDHVLPLLERALKHMAELDYSKAQGLLEQVLAKNPDHISALTHLFNITKLTPESPAFHQAAVRMLSLLSADRSACEAGAAVYREYIRCSPKPKLPPPLYLEVAIMLAASGDQEQAAKIITALLKKMPDLPGAPTALWKLSEGYRAKGLHTQREQCLYAICTRYPRSSEAETARRLMPSA